MVSIASLIMWSDLQKGLNLEDFSGVHILHCTMVDILQPLIPWCVMHMSRVIQDSHHVLGPEQTMTASKWGLWWPQVHVQVVVCKFLCHSAEVTSHAVEVLLREEANITKTGHCYLKKILKSTTISLVVNDIR